MTKTRDLPNNFTMVLRVILTTIAAFATITTTCAAAKACGYDSTSYDDVDAVLFTRNGCGTPLSIPPRSITCSRYWVFSQKGGQIRYSQEGYIHDGEVIRGGFLVDIPFATVVHLLQEYNFFGLNPRYEAVTDRRDTILSVRHCGVVTRIILREWPGGDARTNALFDAIDNLVEESPKSQISRWPLAFNGSYIFNGN